MADNESNARTAQQQRFKRSVDERNARVENATRSALRTIIDFYKDGGSAGEWQKGWTISGKPMTALIAQCPATGNYYSGINQIILQATALERGLSDLRFVTPKQAKKVGGHVRKEELDRGIDILRPVMIEVPVKDDETLEEQTGDQAHPKHPDGESTTEQVNEGNGERIRGGDPDPSAAEDGEEEAKPKTRRMVIYEPYTVYAVEQCDGVPSAEFLDGKPHDMSPADVVASRFLEGMGVGFGHDGGDRAVYLSSIDRIAMPAYEAFSSDADYVAVKLHEGFHATGAEQRMNRPEIVNKADKSHEDYAIEELSAEFFSMVAGQWLGLPAELDDNHRAYLAHWEKQIEEPPEDANKATRSRYRRSAIRALRAMSAVTKPAQALAHVATGDLQAAAGVVEWFDPERVATPADAAGTLPTAEPAETAEPAGMPAAPAEEPGTADVADDPVEPASEPVDYTRSAAGVAPFDALFGRDEEEEEPDPVDAFEAMPSEGSVPGF